MSTVKFERINSALAPYATHRPDTVLIDEQGRMWLPNTSGGHHLPGPGQVPLGGARLVTDGNSITAEAGAPITISLGVTTDSTWVTWAVALSEHKMRWVEQRARTSMTTLNQKDQLASWVKDTTANYLSFFEGTNSIAGYVTAGMTDAAAARQAFADLLAYLNEARSYGKFNKIFIGTIPPRGVTLARNEAHEWYNRQVRNLCAMDGYFVLLDIWKVIADPASATMSAKANHLRADDKLHTTPLGGRAIGEMVAAVWNGMSLPNNNSVATTVACRSGTNLDALYINSNPLLLGGTTGTTIGAVQGGAVVRDGWRAGFTAGTMTNTLSVVADSEGYGYAQQMAITGASSGALAVIAIDADEAVQYHSAGDYVRAFIKAQWSGAVNVDAIYVAVSTWVQSTPYIVNGHGPTIATASPADFDQRDMTVPCYLASPAVLIPGNVQVNTALSANLYVRFGAAGGAITIKGSRGGMQNLGKNPLQQL